MTSVKIDDDGNSHCGFCCSYGNDKDGEEDSVHLFREKVFVESNEIDVDAIQHQLNGHQHRNHIAACKEAIHADEK